jgi:hypothetical protein
MYSMLGSVSLIAGDAEDWPPAFKATTDAETGDGADSQRGSRKRFSETSSGAVDEAYTV